MVAAALQSYLLLWRLVELGVDSSGELGCMMERICRQSHLKGNCSCYIKNKAVLLDCIYTIPANLENDENVMDRPPVRTKTAHFLPVDFENGTLTGTS